MPNWYFIDKNGYKCGLINDQQLKALAVKGEITPDTPVETDDGRKGKAGQLKGLFPATPVAPNNQTVPPVAPSTHQPPHSTRITPSDSEESKMSDDSRSLCKLLGFASWALLGIFLLFMLWDITSDGFTAGKVIGFFVAVGLSCCSLFFAAAKAKKMHPKDRSVIWIFGTSVVILLTLILIYPSISISTTVVQKTTSAAETATKEISERVSQGLTPQQMIVIGVIVGVPLIILIVWVAIRESSKCPLCKKAWGKKIVSDTVIDSRRDIRDTTKTIYSTNSKGEVTGATHIPTTKIVTVNTHLAECRCKHCGYEWSYTHIKEHG